MPKSLQEYLAWLDQRSELIWPRPPAPQPLKATPYVKPLPGIRAVVWSVYGTLLRIDGGRLQHLHPQPLRMQIALQKTIEEFNMWQSMSRKPGAPWEYMLQQYKRVLDAETLKPSKRRGEQREIDSMAIWAKLIDRLIRNEYRYDTGFYGELGDFSEKVAYFFHANLQGVAATENVVEIMRQIASGGLRQGLLDDGQSFTPAQLLRAFRQQAPLHSLSELISANAVTMSTEMQVRKPSPSLFSHGFSAFLKLGIEPQAILYISQRLSDDLAIALQCGVRTALYAADAVCCQVRPDELRNPNLKPDRLLTDIRQIREILDV
ncbi:MAG: HAD family hydrolase [Planctomycetaceae bacterium]